MSYLGNVLGGYSNMFSAVPVVGQALGGLIGGFAAGEQEADQRNWLHDENAYNMYMQYQYNDALQGQALDFARREAEKTRKWNSIGAQMNRAANVGVNPLAVLGTSGAGVSQAQASPVSSSVGLPSVGHLPNGLVDLTNLANASLSLAQARKSDKETSRFDEQIDALLVNYASDVALKKVQIDAQNLANDITKMFGKTKASYECLNLFESALKIAAEGKKAQAEELVAKATEKLRNSENKSLEMQIPLLKQRMEKEVELVGEQVTTEQSKQEANRASAQASTAQAGYYNALGQTEDERRDSLVKISKAEATLKTVEAYIAKGTQGAQIAKFQSELREQLSREVLTDIEKFDAENFSALHRLLFSDKHHKDDVGKSLKLIQRYMQYHGKN